jgi:hypothetical protein
MSSYQAGLARRTVMRFCRLVCYSKYNISSRCGVADDLKQIFATVIRANSAKSLTGGLIFNRQIFGQVLEGDHAALTQIFVRINGDPRHRDIVLAEMKQVSERLFGAWSMGYAGKSELIEALCAKYGLTNGFDPTQMSGPNLTAFVLTLVTQEDNVAYSQTIEPPKEVGDFYEV